MPFVNNTNDQKPKPLENKNSKRTKKNISIFDSKIF